MGYLQYGRSGTQITFDDRALAHIQVVAAAKLRRRETFFFSWLDDPAVGDGRSSVWMSSNIPLLFHFAEAVRPELNHECLELLTRTANGAQGLFLLDEPGHVTPRPQANPVTASKKQPHQSTHVALGTSQHLP